jgi:uncharacterized protein YcbX
MVTFRIATLTLYPVKSCAGIAVSQLRCGLAGPDWDREWMIVDSMGKFVTQRELPHLALVKPNLDLDRGLLRLSFAGEKLSVEVPLSSEGSAIETEIWGDSVPALDEGKAASQWLSQCFGAPLRLARITPRHRHRNGADPRSVKFVDSYPLHLASLASLVDLNRRLVQSVTIERFRANVVITGGEAWQEDDWGSLRMGGISFRVGKRCERCVITTVDPITAEKSAEPLKTLAGFRRNAKDKIEFGQYLHTPDGAVLSVGMDVAGT